MMGSSCDQFVKSEGKMITKVMFHAVSCSRKGVADACEENGAKSSIEKGPTKSLSSSRNRIQVPTWFKKF